MNVDGINTGVVLDHIKAGKSMELYHYLNLNQMDCCIAIIKNVKSNKLGKKDIIKIDAVIDLDLDVLGYLDPNITVNIVKDGKVLEKKKLKLPTDLKNVIKCKNPRCITSSERDIDHLFRLTSPGEGMYRCVYCETEAQ
ncbi:MAG: aspartate carbamoyltransferase regulatory subunit [Clostridiales bacterium]|jgi:aspartate carbamoyltransferase regulatory subunit|nr:aspartate carbamoyltransferase regulatory subunit [Clostridiales bacterium]